MRELLGEGILDKMDGSLALANVADENKVGAKYVASPQQEICEFVSHDVVGIG